MNTRQLVGESRISKPAPPYLLCILCLPDSISVALLATGFLAATRPGVHWNYVDALNPAAFGAGPRFRASGRHRGSSNIRA